MKTTHTIPDTLTAEQMKHVERMKTLNSFLVQMLHAYQTEIDNDIEITDVISVLSKLCSSMAIHLGMTEEGFTDAMRQVYLLNVLDEAESSTAH